MDSLSPAIKHMMDYMSSTTRTSIFSKSASRSNTVHAIGDVKQRLSPGTGRARQRSISSPSFHSGAPSQLRAGRQRGESYM